MTPLGKPVVPPGVEDAGEVVLGTADVDDGLGGREELLICEASRRG
ncbi:hypothetical protein ACU686_40215 [Yinghuangia aomiensis]